MPDKGMGSRNFTPKHKLWLLTVVAEAILIGTHKMCSGTMIILHV